LTAIRKDFFEILIDAIACDSKNENKKPSQKEDCHSYVGWKALLPSITTLGKALSLYWSEPSHMVQADSNSEASAEDSLEFESGSLKIQGFS
jgi:hypothetical protein